MENCQKELMKDFVIKNKFSCYNDDIKDMAIRKLQNEMKKEFFDDIIDYKIHNIKDIMTIFFKFNNNLGVNLHCNRIIYDTLRTHITFRYEIVCYCDKKNPIYSEVIRTFEYMKIERINKIFEFIKSLRIYFFDIDHRKYKYDAYGHFERKKKDMVKYIDKSIEEILMYGVVKKY